MIKSDLKIFNYKITGDPEECDHDNHYDPELQELLNKTYREVQKQKHRNPQWLLKLIEKYPHIPALKNYLTVFYNLKGNVEKTHSANHWLVKEHPEYLFGKLNLCAEYLKNGRLDEIPKLLGQALDLQDLYPERKVFHITEFSSFLNISCRYFIEKGDFDVAESRLEPAIGILGKNDPVVQSLLGAMDDKKMEFFEKREQESYEKRGNRELGRSYDKSVQTTEPPVFNHPEIWALYEHGIDIDHDILRKILALPRKTLVADLETVLLDSLRRFEFFTDEAEFEFDENRMGFPLHALFLLTELRATESLPAILDHLRQGSEFLEFWYSDHVTETLWHFLFHLAQSKLDVLKEFMQEKDVHHVAKWAVAEAVEQMFHHLPHKKEESVKWFEDVFDYFIEHRDDPYLMDSQVVSSKIYGAVDINQEKFLPIAKKCYDYHLVDWGYAGNYEQLVQEIEEDYGSLKFEMFRTIFEHYKHILKDWYGIMTDEERAQRQAELRQKLEEVKKEKAEAEEKLAAAKAKLAAFKNTGRNDPCPCGSGKKFKKCCWGK